MTHPFPVTILTALIAAGSAPASALQLYQAGGDSAASVLGSLNDFRAALGANNGAGPGPFAGGRREINWDAVSDALSDPNFMPSDQFNGVAAPRARGVEFTTPGAGVMTSAKAVNPSNTPVGFGFAEFSAFSAERMFSPIGSTQTNTSFHVPGSPAQAASVNAFGAIFLGVDSAGSARIDAYDLQGALIGSVDAPTGAFSFAAMHFDDGQRIGEIRLTSGTLAIGSQGLGDRVVMDDFIYGEPLAAVPEPASAVLLAAGLAGVLAWRRRRPR